MNSLLKRIWGLLRKPTRFRGRDLEGNKFYEYPSSTDDPRRTKRMIEYYPPSRKWDYVSGQARLPVQWSMWLTHTRPEPPTLEELQADLARQLRVQQSASRLEEQYKIERKEQKLLPEARKTSEDASSEGKLEPTAKEGYSSIPSQETIEKRKRMMAPPSTPPPETQSWTPRVIRR